MPKSSLTRLFSTQHARRGAGILASAAAIALVATGCAGGADEAAPSSAPAEQPSAAPSSPAAAPSTAAPSQGSQSGFTLEGEGSQALLDAAATALAAVEGTTVTAVDSERHDTVWEVELTASDGATQIVIVSADGSTIEQGPTAEDDDAEDRAENAAALEAASVAYDEAVAAVEQAQQGVIAQITLEEDDGRAVWEADVRDGQTQYDVQIDAAKGEVLFSQIDD